MFYFKKKLEPQGGVEHADVTKSSRSFGYGGTEVIECPIDIDDYMVAPCVFPENDDGECFYCPRAAVFWKMVLEENYSSLNF